MTDEAYMRRALFHARRGAGRTTPNPMVGAVVVTREGVVAGQGYHHAAGGPHAEVHALAEAGAAARGSTLYVTLEPCCHTGRTGPCTERIRAAGVARVVAAMEDPNPRVAGGGFAALRAGGVAVDIGVLAGDAARLAAPFATVQRRGRPFVILKAAISLDGRLSAGPGVRTKLTSQAADRRVHSLRAEVDAIGVGSETVLVDDPLLTVRECHRARPLTRVIFDRRLRTPPAARLFSTLADGPVIIVTTAAAIEAGPAAAQALIDRGAQIVAGSGAIAEDLPRLLAWDIGSLLIEGGARMHRAAWHAGVVDRVHLIVAPVMAGKAGVAFLDVRALPLSRVRPVAVAPYGPDVWIEADVHRDH
ncbi:MAG: bifunctional diaminohydroxyphosphoribosylaminopyrimidine deaminase/5-amino-6-(5-phosphoribosylamino)uracil reductase RibD [Acidobacteriota bacterium]